MKEIKYCILMSVTLCHEYIMIW